MNDQFRFFRLSCFLVSTAFFITPFSAARADGFEQAIITVVKNRVLIYPIGKNYHTAAVKEVLSSYTRITTGKNSHVELRFTDQSLVRLGSDTIFSFDSNTREIRIQQGIAFIEVPTHRGDTKIITPLGTALIHRDLMAVRSRGEIGPTEFVRLSPKERESVVTITSHKANEQRQLGAGQLLRIYPADTRLKEPVDISVAVFADTSSLLGHPAKANEAASTKPPSSKVATKARSQVVSTSESTGDRPAPNNETDKKSNGSHAITNFGASNRSSVEASKSIASNATTSSGQIGVSSSPTRDDSAVHVRGESEASTGTAAAPTSGTISATHNNSGNTEGNGSTSGGVALSNGPNESTGHDITVETGNTPVAGGTTVTADTPVTGENLAHLTTDTSNTLPSGSTTGSNETNGSTGHDITVETGNTPVAGGTTVTADTPVTGENLAHITTDTSNTLPAGTTTGSNETNGATGHDITVETGNTPVAGGTTVTADTPVTGENLAHTTVDTSNTLPAGTTTGSNETSGSTGHDITVETGNTPVAGGTTVTADTPVTGENLAHTTVDASNTLPAGTTTGSNETNGATGHDITVETGNTPVAGGTTVTADTPVTGENLAHTTVDTSNTLPVSNTTGSGETTSSTGHDITLETGTTPVAGGTTVTADTPVTGENFANITADTSSTIPTSTTPATSETSGSTGHDITVETGNTPIVGGTTITADTPVTGENFASLSTSGQTEITHEETAQVSQIQAGTLDVTSQPTEGNTTGVASTGTSDLQTSTAVNFPTTSTASPADTGVAPNSTITASADTTVQTDVTSLVQTEVSAGSLVTQTTANPTQATVVAEEKDTSDDITEETPHTSTDLTHANCAIANKRLGT